MLTKKITELCSIIISKPKQHDFRAGDVRKSKADVSKTEELLGYAPSHRISQGIDEAMPWYKGFLN